MMVTVIDDELLVVLLKGNLDAAALQRLTRELIEIERVRHVSKRIVIAEALAAISVKGQDLLFFIISRPKPPVATQTAFVASSELQYGMARMFQSMLETEKKKIEVFRDLESAAQWLKADLKLLARYAQG